MRIEFIEDNTGELAQEEVNKWRVGADNMARLYEDAKRRIAELEAARELWRKSEEGTLAQMAETNERFEGALSAKRELEAQLAEAHARLANLNTHLVSVIKQRDSKDNAIAEAVKQRDEWVDWCKAAEGRAEAAEKQLEASMQNVQRSIENTNEAMERWQQAEARAEAMRKAASERQHAANAEAKLAEAKDDIEELTICEDCGEEDAKLEVNNCWPPRYCHGCRHKLVTEICELRKRAEIAEAKEGGTA